MQNRSYAPYIVFILLSLAAGALGSFLSFNGVTTWYASLTQPSWTPPNWVFAPVWTVLYVLMGLSMALVWKATSGERRSFLVKLFLLQLVVNAAWSYLFFALQSPLLALLDIVLLLGMIASMLYAFSKHSRTAAYLLVPYLVWVLYASTLNIGIYALN